MSCQATLTPQAGENSVSQRVYGATVRVGGRNRKSSGSVKSSAQSESETGYSFTFAVLSKHRRRAVSTYALDGFRKNCLKSSPRRGLYFSARQSNNPYYIDIACAHIYLTSIVIRQISYFILYLRVLKY